MDINFISAKEENEGSGIFQKLTSKANKVNVDPILKYLLYVGLFLIPLWFLPFTADILELNKSVLVSFVAGGGLLLWLINLIGGDKLKTRSKSVALAAAAFVIIAAISTAMGLNTDTSVFGFSGSYSTSLFGIIGSVALFFLIVSTGVVEKVNLRHVVVGSTFVALLIGTLQILGIHVLPFDFTNSRAFNSVGTYNSLGILGAVVFPLLFVLPDKKWLKGVYVGAGVLALFTLVVINWWIVWAPLFIGSAALILKLRGSKMMYVPIFAIALGLTLTVFNLSPLSDLKNNLPLEISPSWNASYDIVKDSLSNKPERLALGYGPESFKFVYDMYRPSRISATLFSDISFVDSTSELVNTVTHLGFAGFLALAATLFMAIRMAVRGIKTGKDISVLAALLGMTAAFVLYPFNVTLFSMFWVFLGLAVISYGSDSVELDLNKSNLYSAISSTAFTLVLVAVLSGLYFASTTLAADIKFGSALKKSETTELVNGVLDAIDTNAHNQSYSRFLSRTLLSAINEELNSGKAPEVINANIQRMMAVSVEAAKSATDRNPDDSQNWLNRGFVYENLLGFIEGAETWALRSYEEALNLRPEDPFTYTRIGRTHLGRANLLISLYNRVGAGDPQAPQIAAEINSSLATAENSFRKALEINGVYGSAIYNLGAVYERQGRLDEAANQLEAYKQVRPNDAGLAFELGLLRYRLGQKDAAFKELQRAVGIFSDYSNARWYLALLYEERGDIDNAIIEIERILKLNPGNELATQKLEELKAGITSIPPDEITDVEPVR